MEKLQNQTENFRKQTLFAKYYVGILKKKI